MKTASYSSHRSFPFRILRSLLLCLPILAFVSSSALVSVAATIQTNWIAFNDHAPSAATAPFVSAYNLRGIGLPTTPTLLLPVKGPLTNFVSGAYPAGHPVSAQVVATAANVPNLFPNAALATPVPGTPAYQLFNGIADLANADSAIGLSVGEGDEVVLTFTNLNSAMRYVFFGTVVRNGPTPNVHPGRWTIASIKGAASFVAAHTAGVLTPGTPGVPGLTLTNGQGVFQSGVNTNGEMVGWTEIQPGANGTFSVVTRGYSGPVTGGSFGTLVTNAFDNLGYALCAFMLAEYGPLQAVAITTQPAGEVALTRTQPLRLSVTATGSSPYYQWFKQGVGPVPGATSPTLSIRNIALTDAGTYYAVVSNSVSTAISSTTVVTVTDDTVAPTVTRIVPGAALDSAVVEFSEPLDPSAGDEFFYAITAGNGAEIMVADAILNADGRSVLLTLSPTTPLIPDTGYTLAVVSLTDLAGNPVPPNSAYAFQSFTSSGAHGLVFEAYRPIAGNPVSNLTSSALFPNSPAETLALTRFDSREVYPDDSHEAYGARIRGLFIPPISGSYKFYLYTDDGGELWLNPTGPSAFGKSLIASEPACCHTFLEDTPASLTSLPVPLTAGIGYYIEALYKEGGGGDLCRVAAKLETDPVDPGTLNPIPGNWLGYPTAPAGVGGPVAITQQPVSLSVPENASYVFSVRATNHNGLPLSYQWMSNGVAIAGATGPTLTGSLASVTLNNGAIFAAAVSVIGTTAISDPATLTVIPDNTAPTIVKVTTDEFFKKITVVFSELVAPATAVDEFAYAITGGSGTIEVMSAELSSDGKTVVLTLSEKMAENTVYGVAAPFVTDVAGNEFSSPPTSVRSL